MLPERLPLDTLMSVMADHTAVSEGTTGVYLIRAGSKLAFWASQIALITNEVAMCQSHLDVVRARVMISWMDNPPEGRKPTKAEAELRVAVHTDTIAAGHALALAERDLSYTKRCFTALERGGSHVQAVMTTQNAELRHLSLHRGEN